MAKKSRWLPSEPCPGCALCDPKVAAAEAEFDRLAHEADLAAEREERDREEVA